MGKQLHFHRWHIKTSCIIWLETMEKLTRFNHYLPPNGTPRCSLGDKTFNYSISLCAAFCLLLMYFISFLEYSASNLGKDYGEDDSQWCYVDKQTKQRKQAHRKFLDILELSLYLEPSKIKNKKLKSLIFHFSF